MKHFTKTAMMQLLSMKLSLQNNNINMLKEVGFLCVFFAAVGVFNVDFVNSNIGLLHVAQTKSQ